MISPVLQGSALWRALIPPTRRSGSTGAAKRTEICSRSAPDSYARDSLKTARETVSGLLDSGSTASRHDEPGFAGVCPMASPDPADTKIRAVGERRATASRSRERPRFVRKGLEGFSHTCRAIFPPKGDRCDGCSVTAKFASTAGGAGARERGAPQSPVGVAGCAQNCGYGFFLCCRKRESVIMCDWW
jgi:hypothetical protein